ncbi:MAG: arginine deiminase [Peptostreptococcaceae bacterium]
MSIEVTSEIKTLKKVLLHRPGSEIENLTPEYLNRLLFDDIPYLSVAVEEHDVFADILRKNDVEVVYLHKLMEEILKDSCIKSEFIDKFIEEAGIMTNIKKQNLKEYLNNIETLDKLIFKTMSGIRIEEIPSLERTSLMDYIETDYPFITDPMPNLYFTRDPFATIGNYISLNKMYSLTRNRETIYSDFIIKYHPDFKNVTKIYNRDYKYSIEGGDILNLNEKTIAIGISQRTTPQAIESIAYDLLFKLSDSKISTILAFNIPKTRAYMHLDTVFTQVDYDKFTIHPQIQGIVQVFEITRGKSSLKIREIADTLENILSRYLDIKVTLIQCGGGDYITSQREQWNDGSNTLCIRPGEVIVYSRNYVTNRVLEENGIKVNRMPSSELSRGRGGPRCMSMPLIRER